MPFFSIVLPTYNRAHFLPKAIDSVLSQTFTDWELIIIDDGSTDKTKDVVTAYGDPRIKYIYQENQERSAARNNGISNSEGEYICFLDSDDYYLPEKLNDLKKFIDNSEEKDCVFYDGLTFANNGKFVKTDLPSKKEEETVFEFLVQHPLGSLQICAPINAFTNDKFNTNIRIGEDIELWVRLAETFAFIPIHCYNTIAVEHEDRSVNIARFNSSFDQKNTFEYIFSLDRNNIKYNRGIRKMILSNTYFNIAKYYMYRKNKFKAIFWIFKSWLKHKTNPQTKHRLYCMSLLMKGQLPSEYTS